MRFCDDIQYCRGLPEKISNNVFVNKININFKKALLVSTTFVCRNKRERKTNLKFDLENKGVQRV